MSYTITITEDTSQALAFVKFARTLDFVKVTKIRTAKKNKEAEELEEDEYGMPIKYREEIMRMSKEANRNMARRLDAILAEREKKESSNTNIR
ncbi:glutaredoxin-2 domain protein [Capnocytophaga bilenii]|uniref:glutaredoxin-2 domain protein n=1 Tax=Capnocytophaga bilenii TaxID=2819369 RepID=UPI0028D3F5FE|nr:glutaredoxin-2 domain protein [Capnocytophaga bilenii]